MYINSKLIIINYQSPSEDFKSIINSSLSSSPSSLKRISESQEQLNIEDNGKIKTKQILKRNTNTNELLIKVFKKKTWVFIKN